MKIQPLKRLQTGNPEIDKIQQYSQEVVMQIQECPLIRGQLVSGEIFLAAPTVLNHRLGRMPEGWIIVDLTSAGSPVVTRAAWDARTITLATSVDAVIALWVF